MEVTVSVSRRLFLLLGPIAAIPLRARQAAATDGSQIPATFPAHEPDAAREMVGVSHGNVARVKALLANRPALAKASWDWGYGDWETAIGAASHVGNREIAALLLAAGAHPTIFTAAMLGQLDAVKAFVSASPGIQKTKGPHGISLVAHARAGGPPSADVVKYLESLGDADPRYTNEPLTDADRAAIGGAYGFGAAASDQLVVAAAERVPTIQRQGGVPRTLFHLGGRVFHPVGADAVRITFSPGERADAVTIEDGSRVVTARRLRA
jgi:hypothetical protein